MTQARRLCLIGFALLSAGWSGCTTPMIIDAPSARSAPAELHSNVGVPAQAKPLPHEADSIHLESDIEGEPITLPQIDSVDVGTPAKDDFVIRGQSPSGQSGMPALAAGTDDHFRERLPSSGNSYIDNQVTPVQYSQSTPPPGYGSSGYGYGAGSPSSTLPPPTSSPYGATQSPPPSNGAPVNTNSNAGYNAPTTPFAPYGQQDPITPIVGPDPYAQPPGVADLVVDLEETQTGRFMFGVGVNSDLGLSAQIVIDERNFDWRRFPRSWSDITNGTAFRGGGQSLRIEAVPGTEVQRYLVSFTEPYLFDTAVSLNLSGYLFDRRYLDWDEQRLGGRVGFGYRLTPDLSLALSTRIEQVELKNPRVRGIEEIERALGESDIYSGRATLTHDTRDIPFSPTQGHFMELSYEQVFGTFDYPRGEVDFRKYFLLRERADRSGRHTLGLSFQGGISGSQTPVYENFFAGGYSTLRGFRFRSASPTVDGVIVGGELSLLGSAEYIFPITADDMLKGAVFCDYGTVEEELSVDMEDFRVAVGAGLRISVPAMGPAPIAVDFAVPVNREDTDRIQNFSFFVGFGR